MDHDYIEKNQIIDRYLQKRLSASEADLFAAHSMSCDDCLTQLEMAERMQAGLARAFEEDAALFEGIPASATGSQAFTAIRTWMGWAAALLLGALALWFWLVRHGLNERLDSALTQVAQLESTKRQTETQLTQLEAQLNQAQQPVTNLPVLQLQPLRGSAGATGSPSYELYLNTAFPLVVLSLAVVADVGPFEVKLLNANQDLVWQSKGLEMDVHGQVIIGLPTKMLKAGDYRIQMFAKSDGDALFLLSNYDFRVTDDASP